MAIEDSQRQHNTVITAVGNNSGSNDFRQHKHDLNEGIIKAAGAFAAGKTLGLSEEEVLQAVSRQRRRNAGQTEADAANAVTAQFVQASNSLSDVSPGRELRGVGYQEQVEVDPFGQGQDELQEFGGFQASPEQARAERVKLGFLKGDDLSEDEKIQVGEAVDRPQSGAAGVRDALNKLEGARQEQRGLSGVLSGVFGGGNVDLEGAAAVAGRLEDSLGYGPVQRGAEQALAAELVDRDNSRFSGRRAAYNNIKGQIEAEQIGERLYRPHIPGAITGAMVGDANLELAGINRPVNFGTAGFNAQGIAFDPATGNPIGQQGPVYQTPNTADSAQALNAPGPMTARQWMVEAQPGYREGGRVFGDYPQVDVTGATTLFADRVRGLQGYGLEGVSTNIRGVDELQRAADAIIKIGGGMDKPQKFYTREPVADADGNVKLKNTRQAEPDIRGVLNKLRYSPAQSQQLANALYQLETAKDVTINQQGKQQYFTRTGPMGTLQPTQMGTMTTPGGASVIFDSPEAIDPRDGQAPVARVNPGQTVGGRDIVTAFKGLETPGAQQPFIGQVEGESPRVNRYNTTGETDPVKIESALRRKEEGFSRKTGKPVDEQGLRGKVVKAQLTEERAKRDDKKRQEKERTIAQYSMANPANVGRMIPPSRRM